VEPEREILIRMVEERQAALKDEVVHLPNNKPAGEQPAPADRRTSGRKDCMIPYMPVFLGSG
jgi:hypothetical protein